MVKIDAKAFQFVRRSLVNYNILTAECLYSLAVGIITALAAICFNSMIEGVRRLSLASLPEVWWSIPISLSAGGLLTGLFLWWRAHDLNPGGVSGVITSVFAQHGLIHGRVALIRMISSALTIGSGGSAGREGPIVQIGASLGSKFAQVFKLSEHHTVILLACGVAAGISSAFNAPIAGIFFALEIILARFTYHSFSLIVLSSVTSCLVTRLLVGDMAEFSVPIYTLQSSWEMIPCLGLGLAAALTGVAFTRSLAISEKFFVSLRCPSWLKPALGGLLCGCLAVFYPQIMAGGYEVMNEAMNGHLLLPLMLVLAVAKILGTSLILGSGGAGGDLAPSLFIGCMLGGVYGGVVNSLFPDITSPSGAYALIGMAAVFAGAARAPLTAVFMIFETTMNYHLLMPLLASSVVATLFASALDKESLYTLKLSRSVLEMQQGNDVISPLESISVAEVMKPDFAFISPNDSVHDLIGRLKETGYSLLAVTDERGIFCGQADRRDIIYWKMRCHGRDTKCTRVKEIMRTDVEFITPHDSLATAVRIMCRCRCGCLPVVESASSRRLLAMLDRHEILQAFSKSQGDIF
ncbi:MAG: chloride channel protein [Candidatus Bruticola sp.]